MTLHPLDRRWPIPALAAASLVAALTQAALVDEHMMRALLREDGPVEMSSAALHFVAAGVALIFWRRASGFFSLVALCALLMGLRELDLHEALTTHGIFTTKLYARDHVPLHEKILGAAMVFAILGLVGWRLRAARADLRRLWVRRSPAIVGLAALLVFAPLLKLVDGAGRMAAKRGLDLPHGARDFLKAFEELGELALPVLVILLLCQAARGFSEPVGPPPFRN